MSQFGSVHPGSIRDKAAVALAEIPIHLRSIGVSLIQIAGQGEQHVYTIAPANDGRWGVFCLACSQKEEDYIYPCKQKADRVGTEDHPPQLLVPVVVEVPQPVTDGDQPTT